MKTNNPISWVKRMLGLQPPSPTTKPVEFVLSAVRQPPTSEKHTVQYVRITHDVADKLRVLRNYPEEARKQARSQLFKAIKRDCYIPADRRIKINIENEQAEMFMVVCDKATGWPWCYNDADHTMPFLSALDASQPKNFMDAESAVADKLLNASALTAGTMGALVSGVSSHEEAERIIAAAKAATSAERRAGAVPALAAPYSTKRYAAIDIAHVRRLIATAARLLPDDASVPLPAGNPGRDMTIIAEGLYLHDGKFYIERPAS